MQYQRKVNNQSIQNNEQPKTPKPAKNQWSKPGL